MKWSKRGDTLVEVVFAMTIITAILVSAFAVTASATRLGRSAKERAQAANYLQEQGEALRNFRDSHSWSDLTGRLTASPPVPLCSSAPVGPFYATQSPGAWNIIGGEDTSKSPYTISFTACRPATTDKYRFILTATWPSPNGAVMNRSTVTTYLVNLGGLAPKE